MRVMGLVSSLIFVFSLGGYGLLAEPAFVGGSGGGSGGPGAVASASVASARLDVVETACELVCRGEFEEAGKIIERFPSRYDARVHRLSAVVHEYRALREQRRADREAAYREQLAELGKLTVAAESNDIDEVGELTKALSVIARASEFADEKQKGQLFSDSFVRRVFGAARDKAAAFESEGKWLDAYIHCYSWLQAIEPENEKYSDYAGRLVEKANIVGSFQDNPCESREERYEKIEKQMFVRAIEALNFHYVSIMDYQQMAAKAIRRCELLGDVINSSSEVREALGQTGGQYYKKLTAWSAALSAINSEVSQSATGFSKKKFLSVLDKVLALNATTLELPSTLVVAHFAEAALSALDPYTVMVWPRQVQDFEKTMTNEFTGVGIEITKQKGLLTVAGLLPDTPAYNAGLDAGDVIEKVDGLETKDMSLTCAVRKITGPEGTEVTLTIKRPGEDQRRDISIIRAKIVVPTIRGWQRSDAGHWEYLIDDENKVGYVRITSFSGTTASDLEEVLKRLEAGGLRGLILDLRFNSGGLLDSAVEVSDKFIGEGLIVRTQPRWGVPTYVPAHKETTHPDYPLVILINRFSASASEIVSGVLQDRAYQRAVLVGERTHGKGSVQGITTYPGGGAQLKYTMAYYHLPSGQRVESRNEMEKQGRKDWGVGPDIEIELRSDELKKLLDVQRDNDVLVQAYHDNGSVPLKKRTLDETLSADPHLAVGLLVARTKLIQEEAGSARRETAQL
jgi:carboxyl-terminal processing protease